MAEYAQENRNNEERKTTPDTGQQPEQRVADLESTPQENTAPEKTGEGYLIVRVTTALGAIPLQGATVLIRNYEETGEEAGDVIRSLVTDRDGLTPQITLPAPPTASSFVPGSKDASSFFNIDVSYPGYYLQYYTSVPVFDGITSVQNVDLIPLPQNGYPDNRTPDDQRFFDGLNPCI